MSESVYQLKITLSKIEPPIWRRIFVYGSTNLAMLHAVVQDAMGWQNYHLWHFIVGDEDYPAPDPGATGLDATKAKLKDLPLAVGGTFEYVYDYGDDWRHQVEVEGIWQPEPDQFYPFCADGERACPFEDSGGPFHYADMLKIMDDPEDPDFAAARELFGAGIHPDAFDVRLINRILMLAFGNG